MKQTIYMATEETLRILDTKPYSHQEINILSKDASFNINENSAHNTLKCF